MAEKYTAQQREDLIAAYRASGQTQNKWCSENGVCKSTLGKWLKNEATKSITWQSWIRCKISRRNLQHCQNVKLTLPPDGGFFYGVGVVLPVPTDYKKVRLFGGLCRQSDSQGNLT